MRTKVIDERRQAGYFPYYKLQVYVVRIAAWRDVQRRFATPGDATKHGERHHQGHDLRLMVVTRRGRSIYQR